MNRRKFLGLLAFIPGIFACKKQPTIVDPEGLRDREYASEFMNYPPGKPYNAEYIRRLKYDLFHKGIISKEEFLKAIDFEV